ncbi:hypothetical protein [Acidithiobacillus ferriphilus]|uniref:hypothetical protein n=1 Tax=Acidithiobacillus ferriphilus TaxID=1689834 RepID=UPI0023309B8F|nr:hypothetical protein [Acidithiobacillus ferriphilus]WCE93986.1 hypothetical protein PJU76_00160 [Acidithiobacillus ferriphilus]
MSQDDALPVLARRGMHGKAMTGSTFHVEHFQVTPQGDVEKQHGMPALCAQWGEVAAALAQVVVRVYIDVRALPLPLRLRALPGHWKLESPWIVSAPLSH